MLQYVQVWTLRLKNITPSGKNSDIDIKSNWNSPSFTGRNLPQQREITDMGFTAHWDASEYNRPFADFWRDDEYKFDNNAGVFGVTLYQSADFYQKICAQLSTPS